jgi:5-methylcytosine-specific restriction endonuclease McrA
VYYYKMECQFCNKSFSNQYTLQTHQMNTKKCIAIQQNVQQVIREFKCLYCEKIFTTKRRLDDHVTYVCKTKLKETTKLLCLRESNELLKNAELLFKTRINELEAKLKETQTELSELKKSLMKTKKSTIPKSIKTMVWNKYVGSSIAETLCICCQQEKISIRHFHCGHIIPEANGGSLELENMRPICAPCNSSMGSRNMREFVKTFFNREI